MIRYFGSKESLFATVVQFELHLPGLGDVPAAQRGRVLVAHFLDRWDLEGDDLVALLRAAVSNAAARDRMERIFEDQLVEVVTPLVGRAAARERAALIASQMLGLALTRYLLRFQGARAISRDAVIDRVGATLQAYLQV